MLSLEFLLEIERLQAAGEPFCVATIVDGRGSIPQVVGARAVFAAEGLCYGTVGGGRIEAKCAEVAADLLRRNEPQPTHFERWNIQVDLGMSCGGEMALFFEVHRPTAAWNVAVFGAGHVAQKLCRFLVELDCHVLCVDPRAEWLERLPESPRLERLQAEYSDGVARVPSGAAVVLMTMGHATDVPILLRLNELGTSASFIGMIGSETKARVARRELADAGVDAAFIERIVCPIGEDLGDNTPPEIAVSVIAQLLKLRS
jgi:xanthine dehydrogenase accessory factor